MSIDTRSSISAGMLNISGLGGYCNGIVGSISNFLSIAGSAWKGFWRKGNDGRHIMTCVASIW